MNIIENKFKKCKKYKKYIKCSRDKLINKI